MLEISGVISVLVSNVAGCLLLLNGLRDSRASSFIEGRGRGLAERDANQARGDKNEI